MQATEDAISVATPFLYSDMLFIRFISEEILKPSFLEENSFRQVFNSMLLPNFYFKTKSINRSKLHHFFIYQFSIVSLLKPSPKSPSGCKGAINAYSP